MRRFRWIVLAAALAALTLALVACGTEAAPTLPPATASATAIPTVAPTAAPTGEARVEQPGDVSSFRARVELSWSGTYTDGTPAEGSLLIVEESVREPRALHIAMSGDVPGMPGYTVPAERPLEVYVIGDRLITNQTGTWIQTPSSDAQIYTAGYAVTLASQVLGGLTNAEFKEDETRGGVSAKRYAYDQADPQASGYGQDARVTRASGEFSLATDGNYVVQLDSMATGENLRIPTSPDARPIEQGTVRLTSELSGINEPLTVAVPEEILKASSVPDDIPLPADAEQVYNLQTTIQYLTSTSVDEMLTFLRTEMPKHGWTLVKEDARGSTAQIEFEKDLTTLTIALAPLSQSGKTAVDIQLSGAR